MILDWFALKPKLPMMAGIDIRGTFIRYLELSKHGNSYKVESFAQELLPEHAINESEIIDINQVGELLSNLVKRLRPRTPYAAIAVSGASVIIKNIEIAADLGEHEIESQIMLEAERYIPYPLSEVNLDFTVLGPSKKNPSNLEVVLAASRGENIDSRVDLLSRAALIPKVIDVEAFAFERAFTLIESQLPNRGKNQTVAIIDLGNAMTTLNVLHDSRSVYTREQLFGGGQLVEEIQRRYGLSFEEAWLAKSMGGLPEDYETEVLKPHLDALLQQISRSLQFFYSSTSFTELNYIILAGQTATLPGIAEKCQKELGIGTAVANPFSNMTMASHINVPLLLEDAPSWMVCCGLAMRSFT